MREPISSATYFAKSLISSPKETLRSTWDGVRHFGDMPAFQKVFTPLIGGAGALAAVAGVASGDPLAVAVGAFNMSVAGGWLQENGETALAKVGAGSDGPKPPAPPPPF